MPRYDGCEHLSVPQGSAAGDRGYPNVNMALASLLETNSKVLLMIPRNELNIWGNTFIFLTISEQRR